MLTKDASTTGIIRSRYRPLWYAVYPVLYAAMTWFNVLLETGCHEKFNRQHKGALLVSEHNWLLVAGSNCYRFAMHCPTSTPSQRMHIRYMVWSVGLKFSWNPCLVKKTQSGRTNQNTVIRDKLCNGWEFISNTWANIHTLNNKDKN